MFASLRSNVISDLCSKDFWLGWRLWPWLGRKVLGLGVICCPSKYVKGPWFQDKHWGQLAHWIVFLRCFRDPIRVLRIEYRVPRIRVNHHRVPRMKEYRVPRIREIGSLQVHIGYLTFSLKKTALDIIQNWAVVQQGWDPGGLRDPGGTLCEVAFCWLKRKFLK